MPEAWAGTEDSSPPRLHAPATPRQLDAGVAAGSFALMTAETPLLRRLRCSLLGAWLAVAYALAVLVSGLAPSSASAHVLDGTVLCSGLTLPGPEAPEPAGEPSHCKGCLLNPVMACPAQTGQVGVARASAVTAARIVAAIVVAPSPILGLPPSRAPPAA